MSTTPEVPYTRIIRNGKHAPDEPPATIDELLALLVEHPVAPWTTCRPLKKTPGTTFLCGEIRNRAHPFSILSTDPSIVRLLTEAFAANCHRFQVQCHEPRKRRPAPQRGKPRRRGRVK
jgi:hypothetical protein